MTRVSGFMSSAGPHFIANPMADVLHHGVIVCFAYQSEVISIFTVWRGIEVLNGMEHSLRIKVWQARVCVMTDAVVVKI